MKVVVGGKKFFPRFGDATGWREIQGFSAFLNGKGAGTQGDFWEEFLKQVAGEEKCSQSYVILGPPDELLREFVGTIHSACSAQ